MHEALLNFLWKLTEKTNVRAGIYYNSTSTNVNSSEPVISLRKSSYNYINKNNTNNYLYDLFEDKILEWEYDARSWSLQIPIVFNFGINESWSIMLGLNRILNGWEIEDKTTAYFAKRERNENGDIKIETNFGERYTQPKQKITEDFTKVMAGLNVNLSNTFTARLLVDPEWGDYFNLAQWWLSFTAKL